MPGRHRSLGVVFEMSWRTLTPALQQRLARLAVFRSGFTGAAAHSIAEADAQHLAALRDKSLITYDEASDRYAIHPVIRAYAAEKCPDSDPTPHKHADYYLTLLAEHAEALQKDAPQRAVAVIQPDMDNVRRAWQTGLALGQVDLLAAALTSLSVVYQLRGLAQEAESAMQTTVRIATTWGAQGIALATRTGLEQARFQNRLGRYRPALETLKAALQAAAQCDDRWANGMGHVLWGESLWRLGEYEAATDKLTHALRLAHALDATLIVGWCHHHLGVIDDIQGRYAAALDHLQQACDAWRAIDNTQNLSNSLNSIGAVCYHQGNLSAAQRAMEEALALCNQLDNRHLQSLLLNNLGMIATQQGDYVGAQYYLQIGLDLAVSNGNLTGQGELNVNLGKNYRLMGKIDLAVEHLEEGVQIAESLGNRSLLATALFNLADAERDRENEKWTKTLYHQALAITQQDNLQSLECEVMIGLAEFLSKRDEGAASEYSTKAVSLAEVLQHPALLQRAKAVNQYTHVFSDVNEGNRSA